jgi:hypothetical protein
MANMQTIAVDMFDEVFVREVFLGFVNLSTEIKAV